jgi:hypothetical protein
MPTVQEITEQRLGRISWLDIYPKPSMKSDENRVVSNHSPHERDPITANRGSRRIAPGGILRPVYDVVAFVDQLRCIGLDDIQTR